MNRLLSLAYRVQRVMWRLFRPRTRGVKVMLFNAAGEILLIRNGYGRTDLFVLPGGGVRPFETFEAAARREVHEEVGCAVERLSPQSTHRSNREGKRDTIRVFTARTANPPVPDGREVEEARFFPIDRLPETASPATLRRIQEYRGERPISEAW